MDLNTVNMIAASRVVKTKPFKVLNSLQIIGKNFGLRVLSILLGFKSHMLFALLALSEVTCQAGN